MASSVNPELVSVVVPAFNASAYLPETLASILAQDHRELEVVVVDDGSTDATGAIVERFAQDDPRVRLVTHDENRGVAAAINTGVTEARGDVLSVFGADDTMMPGNLREKVAILAGHASVGLVFGDVEAMDAGGATLRVIARGGASGAIPSRELLQSLLSRNPIVASSVVLRRECHDVAGMYDEALRHAEDWDMWLRIALTFDGFHLAGPLVRHRLHQGSLRVANAAVDLDLMAMERIIRRMFADYGLGSLGYDFEEVYWGNYFRMLHSKVASTSVPHGVRLYLRGLRGYPRRGVRRTELLLLAKLLARAVLPAPLFGRIQRTWRRGGRGQIGM